MMDRKAIAEELVGMAESLVPDRRTASSIALQKVRPGLFMVRDREQVILGFLKKIKDGGGETFPWQAHLPKFVAGQHPQVGRHVGDFFKEDGGQKAAIKALQRAQ